MAASHSWRSHDLRMRRFADFFFYFISSAVNDERTLPAAPLSLSVSTNWSADTQKKKNDRQLYEDTELKDISSGIW